MDKKKVIELIEDVIKNNVDNLAFGDDKRNAPLRRANEMLHDALIELSKSDWVSVDDKLPSYEEAVLVTSEKDPEEIYFSHRTNRKEVIVDKHQFATYKEAKPITHWRKIDKLEV